jgi:xylulokinase
VLQSTQIDPGDVAAVGLTAQMHGLVLLDERGEVLRPAILWNDQPTSAQCDETNLKFWATSRQDSNQNIGNLSTK